MRTSECDTELPLFEDSAHAPTLNATGRPHSYLLFLQEQIKGLIIVADVNAAIDAAVKEKIDNYQHDYNARNYFFLPAVMTTSGRISGDFLRLLYILSHLQAANYFTRMDILDPSPQAYKQRRGTFFYYNRAAMGVSCAQATAMRIDIAPHKRPRKKPPHHVPDHYHFHIPPHAHLHD